MLLRRSPAGSKPARPERTVTGLRSALNRRPVAGLLVAAGWGPALVFIGIAALVLGIVFRREISGAVQVWIESTAYTHCFLIIPLVGFLLWERRWVIASVSPNPTLWPLVVMPFLSGMWLIAAILDIQEARQFLLIRCSRS